MATATGFTEQTYTYLHHDINQRTWPYKSHINPFTAFPFNPISPSKNYQNTNNPTCSNSQFNPISSSKSSLYEFSHLQNEILLKNQENTNNPTCQNSHFNQVSSSKSCLYEFSQKNHQNINNPTYQIQHFNPVSSSKSNLSDFSQLPNDILLKIAGSFTLQNLRAASLVCKSWCDGLKPLREGMLYLKYGKCYKHGRGGVKVNLNKALDCFLKGVARGSTLAMVDAGLVYWEMGRKEEGICLYRKAAELGDPAGQCNLGICLLQASPPNNEEAIKWLYKASAAGYVRAQYQLALCLHKGRGKSKDLQEAARWYLKAAEGGYVRAMYNTAICYSAGEGLLQSYRLSRKWMKRAADRGHRKAQFEHGLSLFAEGSMMKAVVYLELASRAGETAADHVKYVILQQMTVTSRERAMLLADNWRALPSSSH